MQEAKRTIAIEESGELRAGLKPPAGAPKQLQLQSARATHAGLRRRHNEDTVHTVPHLALFLVADGAGGHKAGEVASRLTALSMENYVAATAEAWADKPEFDRHGIATQARQLSAAVHKANQDVLEISDQRKEHRGMGTTVVACLFSARSNAVHVAHVGDSRCYRLRGEHFEQLTQDHSLVVDVLERKPDMADDDVDALPRNVVTRAVGMSSKLRVDVRSYGTAAGDRYLMCSDGVAGVVATEKIRDALRAGRNPEAACQRLVDLALEAGGPDNIGVVVVDCVGDGVTAMPVEAPDVEVSEEEGDLELLLLPEDGRKELASVPELDDLDDLAVALAPLIGTGEAPP